MLSKTLDAGLVNGWGTTATPPLIATPALQSLKASITSVFGPHRAYSVSNNGMTSASSYRQSTAKTRSGSGCAMVDSSSAVHWVQSRLLAQMLRSAG